jgi:hypothetical protein
MMSNGAKEERMRTRPRAALFSAFVLVAGCTSSNPGGDGGMVDMAQGGGGDMALPPGTMQMRLIESTFNLAPGVEKYQCQRLTLPADMHIVRVIPVSPQGVHHEVLAIDTGGNPDGTTQCNAAAVANTKNLYASGINSPALQMPDKVALKITAGQQIQLNLHLLNASTTTPIDATAAIDVVVAKDATGYELADVPFAGSVTFNIPAGGGMVNGTCTVSNDTKLFAVFPHMHEIGKHIKIVAGGVTVWDDDYNFEDQRFGFHPSWPANMAEVPLKAGDKINVTCTYGPTPDGKPRGFGDSSHQEMCFGISYVHPAIQHKPAGSAFCVF